MNLTVPKVMRQILSTKKESSTNGFPVEHISASFMISIATNPILAKIRYINKDIFDSAMGISGVLGKSFHTAMSVYYGGSDVLIPTNEAEAIEYGLKAGMEYLQNYNDGFINFSKTIENKQKALELLSFCYQSYIKEFPYKMSEVISTEEKIVESVSVDWRGKSLVLPIKLKGFTDKIERSDDKKLRIRDYKTCYTFSNPEKIDGAKIIQAIEYYLLVYAKYGEEPYSIIFDEVKYSKNKDNSSQVRSYEVVYAENELYFDFYFRLYEDIIRYLNGEAVFLPNLHALFDNEISIISYIHRLDETEEVARLMKKHKVDRISDLLKKEIQSAGNMRKLLKTVEERFVSAKNIDYEKMNIQDKIQTKMLEYGIMLQFDSKIEGSAIDLYRYNPSMGVKMSRLKTFVDDIEQVVGISGIRVLAPIPNSKLVGFEVPRESRVFPQLPAHDKTFNLMIGKTIDGQVKIFDIREAPHILVAGSSGSGKSIFLHSMIRQMIQIPNVELHLFDPKQVELFQYEESVAEYKHSPDGIASSLTSLVSEMEKRYSKMKKLKIKNISETDSFNYKVIIIDEYADLKAKTAVDNNIKLLAQKGRACGIHIIIATQRASTKIIDGDVKINFPVKVVFRVGKAIDSRVMIDEDGAEKLLGKGDCLFQSDSGIERLQAFNL